MNEKIKASELFKQLVIDSQKSLASEDEQMKKRLNENNSLKSKPLTYNNVLYIIGMNNEYIRFSLLKTMILTLCNLHMIENDLDILNLDISNDLISQALDQFEAEKN